MVQGIYYSRLECVLDLGMVTLGLQLDAGNRGGNPPSLLHRSACTGHVFRRSNAILGSDITFCR